jgi:hypothetical protein
VFLQRFQQAVGYGAPAVDSRDYRISKYGAAKVEEGEKRAMEIREKYGKEKRAALEKDTAEWSKRAQLEAWRTAGTMTDADLAKLEDYKHLYAKTVTLEKLGQEVDVSTLKGDGKVSQVCAAKIEVMFTSHLQLQQHSLLYDCNICEGYWCCGGCGLSRWRAAFDSVCPRGGRAT